MTRQEARDAARLHIGDTCLLDYEIEQRNCWRLHCPSWCDVNSLTRVLKYSIKEPGNGVQVDEPEPEIVSNEPLPIPERLSEISALASGRTKCSTTERSKPLPVYSENLGPSLVTRIID